MSPGLVGLFIVTLDDGGRGTARVSRALVAALDEVAGPVFGLLSVALKRAFDGVGCDISD